MKITLNLCLTASVYALVALCNKVHAQDETDALRYSFIKPQGTARSMGFGSALGSIGGDFSSLSVNPAGIGIYRKSEAMFTPSVSFDGISSTYQGRDNDGTGAHFAFSNVGIVWTTAAKGRRYERSPWKAVSFGIGINRTADFTRDYSYSGTNTTTSASWVFEANAQNGSNLNDESSPAYLGYQTYLLNYGAFPGGDTGYVSVVNPSASRPVGQTNTVKERGGISELLLSLGGNYQEHLMIGATLGLPVVNYTREKTFEEQDMSGITTDSFEYFRYTEHLRTSGLGINLKFGIIYKPVDAFRIGAAIHTPTYFGLTDVMDANLTANTGIYQGTVSQDAAQTQYDYTLKTPWRGVISATALFGKYGFFTADYEYVDYSSARYSFNDADYQNYINNQIKSIYAAASNVRAGVEIRLDALAFRGGFGYYGNPYKSGSGYESAEHVDLSAGIGIRVNATFLDLAYVHRYFKNSEQPYQIGYPGYTVPTANLVNNQNTVALTVGWKF